MVCRALGGTGKRYARNWSKKKKKKKKTKKKKKKK